MADHDTGGGKKPANDMGYWITAAVFMFMGAWPVSLIMLIVKLANDRQLDKVMDKMSRRSPHKVTARPQQEGQRTSQRVQDVAYRPVTETAKTAGTPTAAASQTGRYTAASSREFSKTAKKQTRDTLLRQPKKGAKLLMAVGAVIAAVGAIVLFGSAAEMISWGYYNYLLDEIFTALGFMLCGGVMYGAGHNMRKRERRYKDYLRVIGKRRIVLFKMLADASGVPVRRVVRDLEEMLEDGNLPEGAFLDRTRECLVLDAAAMPYEQEAEATLRRMAEQSAAQPAGQASPAVSAEAADPAIGEYDRILRRIRTANEDIEDAVMSAKIDRIESIARSIFAIVEEKPERRQEIRSFFNYYLPTTQKLLDFYAQLEAQPVQSQTIVDSRRNIEGIMDNLVKGFENQLDSLFRADALDISSDISVLENMLAQDGLNTIPGEDAIAAAARRQTARPATVTAPPQRTATAAATATATAAMPQEK